MLRVVQSKYYNFPKSDSNLTLQRVFTVSRNSENPNAVSLRRYPVISPPVIYPPLSPSFSPPFCHFLSLHRSADSFLSTVLPIPFSPPLPPPVISPPTKALHDDEYEELKESKLGVFIKFQELGFECSFENLTGLNYEYIEDLERPHCVVTKELTSFWGMFGVHVEAGPSTQEIITAFENLTGLNCEYIEDLGRPHCVVTKELTSFWGMFGVHVEAGPSTQEIITAFERCEGWYRDDCKRLAYLAIFTGYIEGKNYSIPTRVSMARVVMELEWFENYPWGRVAFKVLMDSVKGRDISGCYTINGFVQALQVWVYTALLELGANYGNPLPNNPSPPILAYKGRKGRIQFKEAIFSQHIDAWINVSRRRYDANPQHFRSERMCFLDHLFAQQWRFNYKDFKDSEPDQNGLGRRLPEELDVVMEHFLYMVPYLLVEWASSDEQRAQYSLEPFTYERPTNIPPARAGDCGVYTLKYIECHALGIEFSKKDFAMANGKTMRDKMVVDIFQELPDAHECECQPGCVNRLH
uniref:Ubiquitin-like protease family profile domain-containing protein n=1 Tax=Brassica oleracea var. oleracea TaxID=109376 RepID=A0A0D3ED17_BRAOL